MHPREKIVLPFLILVLLSAGCGKQNPDFETRTSFFVNSRYGESSGGRITCVTYNIQLGFSVNHDPWNKDQAGGTPEQIDAIAAVLKSVNPDIICMQEVPRNRYNVVVKEFIQALAAAMEMNYAFGAHGYNDPYGIEPVRGEWGNAILSRFEILGIDNRENEYHSTWERRSILMAHLRTGKNASVYAYSLHHVPSDKSTPNSLPFFRERSAFPQLILGDFNMTMVPELDSAGYTDVLYGDSLLMYSIDRLYVTPGSFGVVERGIIPGSKGVSDHDPVYCRLTYIK